MVSLLKEYMDYFTRLHNNMGSVPPTHHSHAWVMQRTHHNHYPLMFTEHVIEREEAYNFLDGFLSYNQVTIDIEVKKYCMGCFGYQPKTGSFVNMEYQTSTLPLSINTLYPLENDAKYMSLKKERWHMDIPLATITRLVYHHSGYLMASKRLWYPPPSTLVL